MQRLSALIGSVIRDRADITVFQDHLDDTDAVIERLLPFDIVCVMRETHPAAAQRRRAPAQSEVNRLDRGR